MKTFFSFFLLVLVLSCNPSGPKLEAKIDDVEDGTNVYLTKIGPQNAPIPLDTTQVKNDHFEFDLEPGNQEINLIQVEDVVGNIIFINDADRIKIDVEKDNLRNSKVDAGPHNKLLKDYFSLLMSYAEKRSENINKQRKFIQEKDKLLELKQDLKDINEEAKKSSLDFITTNANSIVGMMALSDIMNSKVIPLNQIKSIYDKFDDEVKDTPLGKMVGQKIAKIGATDIGAEAPKFSGPTPEGKELSLREAMGKLTLIDFWASWCRPCRAENPNIVSVYQDYKDKGFTVIGVSLDKPNSKDAWVKAIEDDNLNWNHISNLKYWQDPIAKKYGVRGIPAAFLIDENGIIVAKDLRGEELRNKVKEILGQ